MKSGLHVFGKHAYTVDVEKIMWGDPATGRFGELTRALEILIRRPDIEVFTMGTGASRKGGMVESEYWFAYMLKNLGGLDAFPGFKDIDKLALHARLRDIVRLDTTSKNTVEEVALAVKVHAACGVEDLTWVTAPTHLPRCVAEVLKIVGPDSAYAALGRRMQFCASDVTFGSVGDVVVAEPRHRGDDTAPDWPGLVRRIYQITRDKQEFYDRFDALLKEWGV